MDEQYLLATPENVPISYDLAGLGSRFVAALLDSLIMLAIQAGLLTISLVTPAATASMRLLPDLATWIFAIGMLLSFLFLVCYPLLFEIAWNGQTPGKRKTGIRIIQDDGGPITPSAAVIRNLVRLVDFLPAYYIIGALAMLIDSKGRRLGDMAAGTVCVRERRDVAADNLAPRAPGRRRRRVWPGRAPLDNLTHLSHEDCYLVKEYLLRRNKLAPGAAHSLAERIASRIAAKLDIELADESVEDFLARVGSELERLGGR